MLVSNNILIFPNYQNKIFLKDTNSSSTKHCTVGGDLLKSIQNSKANNRIAAAIDASGNLVFKSYEGSKVIFRKFTLSGSTACPSNTANATYSFSYDYDLRYSEAMDAHPSNANIFYLVNRMGNRIIKVTLNSTSSFSKNAIVGSTGSGKTNILNLIGRLYEIESGKISFNGKDISKLNIKSVRDQITIVSQDIVIFDQSLEDNIRYADPSASEKMVLEAAQKAKIDSLLLERKGTSVGPNGSQLSGGQKQRIALARAFLKPAPILLLDEATSALDAVTEASIAKSLEKLSKNKTTIVVAHKLSTIENADVIFVMDDGFLVEFGAHSDLMKKRKYYEAMVKAQNTNTD